jgi:octaprenyl-diphosphate synthase
MTMEEIIVPIKDDILAFDKLIDIFIMKVQNEKVRINFQTFFKRKGKYLRPTLLMLAAGSIAGNKDKFDEKLYRLGLILELLHSASLVHDDIVDEDLERRGEKTVNQVFGNKIAVLAGDTLFTYAFKEATMNYEKAYTLPITNLALDMCMAELIQANKVESKEDYLQVICGKTAKFMAVACELGARYAGGSELEIARMYNIGMNLGITYQMVDDLIDGDSNAMNYITEADIQYSYVKTKKLLSELNSSPYCDSLFMLLEFIMEMKKK